jgi:hypothetical protein
MTMVLAEDVPSPQEPSSPSDGPRRGHRAGAGAKLAAFLKQETKSLKVGMTHHRRDCSILLPHTSHELLRCHRITDLTSTPAGI